MGDINKDDLYNMFKSYENNVKYNIQLYDRQDKLIKEQTSMIVSVGVIAEKLTGINRSLDELIKSVSDHNSISHDERADLQEKAKTIKTSIDAVSGQITDLKIGGIKQHGMLRISLVAIASVLSTIVIGLVITLQKMWAKSDIIDAVAKFIGLNQ